ITFSRYPSGYLLIVPPLFFFVNPMTIHHRNPLMAPKKFSKFFTLEELCASDTATLHNVSNVPGKAETKNLQDLAKLILDPVRIAVGHPIKVNSGFRNVKVNRLVGGVSTSAHCYGLAAD